MSGPTQQRVFAFVIAMASLGAIVILTIRGMQVPTILVAVAWAAASLILHAKAIKTPTDGAASSTSASSEPPPPVP